MNKLSVTALILGSGLALAGTVLAGSADHHEGKGPDRMTKLDANKDGKVSLPELVQSKQAWLHEVDTNKDGVATRAEIDASFQAQRSERVNQMFSKQDTNKDGKISREESKLPPRWFARLDTNSDGNLTREELSQHPGRGPGGEGRQQGKLAHLDLNSDGKVDAAELKLAAEQMLKRLDKNSDGSLDATELGRHGRQHGPGAPGNHGDGKDSPAGTQHS